MAFHDWFETVWATLLHQHPLQTSDDAVTALHFEETKLGANPQNSNEVLAVTHSKFKKSSDECTYCTRLLVRYFTLQNIRAMIVTKIPPEKINTKSITVVAATQQPPSPPPSLTNNDFTDMLKQVLSGPFNAMSATLSNFWYFNFDCCNHMTSDSTISMSKNSTPHTSPIKTVDMSQLHITYIGPVSTFNLPF